MLSKALVSGPYQKKCEELAALPGIELTVAVPISWREPRVGELKLERRYTNGYRLVALPIAFNGRHHLHFYPTLNRLVQEIRPDVFHIDEESFNLATFLAMRAGIRVGARCCFYNYANIERSYPPPFSLFERYNFRHAAHALAANREAASIIRHHGYNGPLTILPQFGVDPQLFAPAEYRTDAIYGVPTQDRVPTKDRFMVGYLGRLVPEKGILDLIDALTLLPESVHLRLIGNGDQRTAIMARIAERGLASRIELRSWAADVPTELGQLDALVLPSHTTRTWKEQFGRILVEAMSCAIPVVGSSSGEIPHVIGDAGLVFAEGDIHALANRLHQLLDDPNLRSSLAQRGRERVLAEYTQAALARRYYTIYQSMLA
jgi:glycosyltransferase involved in cell wall biosynthesis